MSSYNVQIINYFDSQQIRIYKKPIISERSYLKGTKLNIDDVKRTKEELEYRSKVVAANRAKQKVYEYARSNEWDYFLTMTFNPALVDSFSFEDCVIKMSNWLNNQRKIYSDMGYIVVPEQHKSGRWHFHALVNNYPVELSKSFNGRTGAIIDNVYNLPQWKFGFNTVSVIKSQKRVSSYITKYITKNDDVPKGKKRYWVSRNLNLPTKEQYDVFTSDFEKFVSCEKNTYIQTKTNVFNSVIYIERGL